MTLGWAADTVAAMAIADAVMAVIWLGVNAAMLSGAARVARRLFPTEPPSLRWLTMLTIFLSNIWFSAIVLGGTGCLSGWSLMAVAGGLGWGMTWWVPKDAAPHPRPLSPKRGEGGLFRKVWMLLAGFALAHVIWNGLLDFPDDFDTLMYHLPIVVEWLQIGSLYTPLSSFWWTPGNGEVLALWMVAPFSGDFLYSLTNVPFVVLWAIGTYRLAREFRLPIGWAHLFAMAAMLVFTTLDELDDCQNDIAIAALFVSGAAFGARYLRRSGGGSLVMMGLCVGALSGVKYNALGYSALVVASVVGLCFIQRRYRDSWQCVVMSVVGFGLLGSYWYVRNWIVSGSPIYPMGLGSDIATGYPNIAATTLWGNHDPVVFRLAWEALWRMAGPLHYGSLWIVPVALLVMLTRQVIILFAVPKRGQVGMSRLGSMMLTYLTALFFGTFGLLLITPMCVEDVPGSLNHLIWSYTPARYGLSFLTMIVIAGGIVSYQGWCFLRHWIRGHELLPISIVVLLMLVQIWLVIAEHNRERRGGPTLEFCFLLFDVVIALWIIRETWSEMNRNRKRLMGIVASLLFAILIGAKSVAWHEGFGEFYNRFFRTTLFSPAGNLSALLKERVMVLEMRCYPFYGSQRQTLVYRPRSIESAAAIEAAMRTHDCAVVATHRELRRDYYLYTHTYAWLSEAGSVFQPLEVHGHFSLFSAPDRSETKP